MERLSYQAVQDNPELLEALMRQARRERAEAVHRLIIAPVARLFAPLELGHVPGRAAQG